jgi:hypothetical protein
MKAYGTHVFKAFLFNIQDLGGRIGQISYWFTGLASARNTQYLISRIGIHTGILLERSII